MGLPSLFAGRYLFAKKSHNVINVISLVSTIGMAIGTAALILILSVYNGFNKVIDSNLSDFDPDILVVSGGGNGMFPESAVAALEAELKADSSVLAVSKRLDLEAFISYMGLQSAVLLRGGEATSLSFGDVDFASVGAGLAGKLQINPRLSEPVEISYLDPAKKLTVSSPGAALRRASVYPAGTFSVNSDLDDRLMEVPMRTVRSLFGSDAAISGLEVRLCDSSKKGVHAFKARYASDGLQFLDRAQQHPELYKMMRLEKAAVFFIMLFVALIVALNVFGSLSMLIIEKKEDIGTLRALGTPEKNVRRIFALEGWLTSLLGIAAGAVIGVTLALVQQKFGLVKMPGNFLVDSYPVLVRAWDVVASVAGVSLIGLLVALAPLGMLKQNED